jgi:hypothetical protein
MVAGVQYYVKNSAEHSKALRCPERLCLERWPGAARALSVARALGRCVYSGAPSVGRDVVLEVDHVVSLELIGELMWQASKAHCDAPGWHLPWPPRAHAWLMRYVHGPCNLLAVTLAAHREKSACSARYVSSLEDSLKRLPAARSKEAAREQGERFVPPLEDALLLKVRARQGHGNHAVMLPGFATLVAEHHRMMALRMQRDIGTLAGMGRVARILVEYVCSALAAVGGMPLAPVMRRARRAPLKPTLVVQAGEGMGGGGVEEGGEVGAGAQAAPTAPGAGLRRSKRPRKAGAATKE